MAKTAESATEALAYLEGVAEGRRQAAEAIRLKGVNYIGDQYRHFQMCARLAEGSGVPKTRQDR